MTTVQLAIPDSAYAQSLRNLLVRDNAHEVLLVDKPDLSVNGVVVIDGSRFEELCLLGAQPERFVVILRKGAHHLTKAWETGVRHVVFEEDSANTAQLAVMAAELRLPKESAGGDGALPPARDRMYRRSPNPGLLVLDPASKHCTWPFKCRNICDRRNEYGF